jgi:hypothetical protein
MILKPRHLFALLAAAAVLAPLPALASSQRTESAAPSAAAPIVTGVDSGGGPYLTVFGPQGQWQAGFLPYVDLSQGGINVATGDVNGDGKDEILTAPGRGGRADVRAFAGDGTQLFSLFAGAGTCGTAIAAGDVDGNGTTDVITANDQCGGPSVQIFDGKSRKRLATFGAYPASDGQHGVRIAAGDVDGDGKAEIVTANGPGEPPTVRVFDGLPTAPYPKPTLVFQAFPDDVTTGLRVAVGDVSGDGRGDILVAAETTDGVQVKAFDGKTGTLLASITAFGEITPDTLAVAVGNIGGDGKAEILVAGRLSNWQHEIRAFALDGTRVATFDGSYYERGSIAVADLRGDGKTEIVATPGPGWDSQASVIDPSDGTYKTFDAYEDSFTGGVRVAAGDLAGDGHTEWVTGQGMGGTGEVGVFDGTGAQLLSLHPFGSSWHGVYVAAGDVNGDRKADIVTGADQWEKPQIKVYDGHGREVSTFLPFDESFQGGVRVATGDVTGDGTDEIIAGAGPGVRPLVRVFDDTGKQLSSFYAFEPSFTGGVFVSAADLDGDGKAEIVVGAGYGREPEVRVFDEAGKELSHFDAYETSFTGGVYVAAGDVFGDGKGEVVTGPAGGRPVDINTFASDGTPLASFLANPDFKGGWFVALQKPLGPRLQASMLPAQGVEGTRVGVEANVLDPGGQAPAGDFGATIRWGNGAITEGSVTSNGTGSYAVHGSNVYARPGRYTVEVRVSDVFLRTVVIRSQVRVVNARIVASGRPLRAQELSFRGVVATVVDRNPKGSVLDYRVRVDWGDARHSTARVVRLRAGLFAILGHHRYARAGRYDVTVRVADLDGGRAVARSKILATRA